MWRHAAARLVRGAWVATPDGRATASASCGRAARLSAAAVGCFSLSGAVLGSVGPVSLAAGAVRPAAHLETAPRKVNAEGEYQRYPGVTVVCDMVDSHLGAVAGLPGVLRSLPTLGPLIAPLPAASYHVTTLDICTQQERGLDDRAWLASLRAPGWARVAHELVAEALVPQLRVRRVLLKPNVVVVELEPADTTTPGHPRELLVNLRVMEILGLTQNQQHVWHFTLGYAKLLDGLSIADSASAEADRVALEAAVRQALPGALSLGAARLCRFEDMLAFTPWDGLAA
mmetsp:Transcript_22801/g.63464  ORF Transcript_22801/g.63464 Transcript_22801/m.63464 type:complete len:286 (-) Transcript_22801:115-972(-)